MADARVVVNSLDQTKLLCRLTDGPRDSAGMVVPEIVGRQGS
jgi:hypothetical protein